MAKLSRHVRSEIFLAGAALITLIPSTLFAFLDYKIAIVWIALSILAFSYARYRESVGEEIIIALFFALFVTAYHPYVYTGNNLLLGHINIFPLFAWTAGLALLREVYERARVPFRLLKVTAIYIIVLFALEYAGYYFLGIRLSGDAPSLWGLGIIHGPVFLQYFYLLAGPVYLLATDYLRVK